MIFCVCILLFVAAHSVAAAPHVNITDWLPVGALFNDFRVAYTCVALVRNHGNASLLTVGGCTSANCSSQSNLTTIYSPASEYASMTAIPDLQYPIAGYGSCAVSDTTVLVLHMCAMLPGHVDISNMSETEREQFTIIEMFDVFQSNQSTTVMHVQIPGDRILVNATCTGWTTGSIQYVYIIGGVDINYTDPVTKQRKPQLSDQIFVFDLTSNLIFAPTDNNGEAAKFLGGEIQHPSVSSDSARIFVTGGIGSTGQLRNQVTVLYPPWKVPSVGAPLAPCQANFDEAVPAEIVEGSNFLHVVNYAGYIVVFSETAQMGAASDTSSRNPTWFLFRMDGGDEVLEGGTVTGVSYWAPESEGTNFLSSAGSRLLIFRLGGIINVTIFEPINPNQSTTPVPTVPWTTEPPNTTTTPDQEREIAPEFIQVNEREVVSNVSVAVTNLFLPAPNVSFYKFNSTLQFGLSMPPREDDVVGIYERCQSRGISCYAELSNDPHCRSMTGYGRGWSVGSPNFIVNTPISTDTNWVCFQFFTLFERFCGDGEIYSPSYVVDLFYPFLRLPATEPPTATVPPPTESNLTALIIVSAVAAVAVLALLVALFVVRRRHQGGNSFLRDSRYEHLSVIGQGAFGKVLKVRRVGDGAIFAMKYIDCPSSDVLHEALREFDVMRRLRAHPNVVRVIDMFLNYEVEPSMQPTPVNGSEQIPLLSNGQNEDRRRQQDMKPVRHLCIVMDYHPAKDLKLWTLSLEGSITEPVLCHIAVQTCSVLAFIHEKGIVHRDLKPENILVVTDEVSPGSPGPGLNRHGKIDPHLQPVVITDFGLAHLLAESNHMDGFVGTAVYSAPESVAILQQQLKTEGILAKLTSSRRPQGEVNSFPVTSQCDMWSLGCVIYACATKRLERGTVRKMFEDVRRGDRFCEDIRAEMQACGYSSAMANFVLRLLRLDPDQRPTAKIALRYFRKNLKDNSYHVTDRVKLTSEQAAAAANSASKS